MNYKYIHTPHARPLSNPGERSNIYALDLANLPQGTKEYKLRELKKVRDSLVAQYTEIETYYKEHKITPDEAVTQNLNKLQEQIMRASKGIEQIEASLPKPNGKEILGKLGDNFDSQFDDGTKTRFAVTTIKGLESILGIPEEILKIINTAEGSPNTNKTYDEFLERGNMTGIIKEGYRAV